MTRRERFMALALAEARLALKAGEVPVGAVVVRGDTVLSSAHNLREGASDPTAHAELLAIRSAAGALGSWRLDGCELYVTLEPCPMCAGAIALARPAALFFGAFDPRAGCCGSVYDICGDRRFGPGVICAGGILECDCSSVLGEFFASRRS